MAEIKDSFAVLGLSKFGFRTAVSLFNLGAKVVAVDRNENLVQKISTSVTKAVCADVLDREILEYIGVPYVNVAIIGLRHAFDVAVLLVNYLKRHTKVERIVAQVDTDEKLEALRILGVDTVVFPEKDIADRVVKQLTMPNLVEHISISPEATIIEVSCPDKFVGRSLTELEIRTRYNVYVIGIKRYSTQSTEPEVMIAPGPETRFQPGDTMLLLGSTENLIVFTQNMENG